MKQIRVDTSFNSWLHGFAIYFVLEEIRKRELNNSELNSSLSMLGKVRQSKIGIFLLSLSTWERIAMVLHDVESYSYSEINDLLWQFRPEEVKNLVSSARKKYLTD